MEGCKQSLSGSGTHPMKRQSEFILSTHTFSLIFYCANKGYLCGQISCHPLMGRVVAVANFTSMEVNL